MRRKKSAVDSDYLRCALFMQTNEILYIQMPNFRMVLLSNRDADLPSHDDQGNPIHAHLVQLPTGQNAAAIYVSDEGNPPCIPGIFLHGKERGNYVYVPGQDPNLDPALYPMLFTRGQQGYSFGLELRNTAATEQVACDTSVCITILFTGHC